MYLLQKYVKERTKSEETKLLTCTFMVPVGSSVMLELVLAVHSYHVVAYPDKNQYMRSLWGGNQSLGAIGTDRMSR